VINPDLGPLQGLINKGDRLFGADENQIMSRAATVPTQQTQQSLNTLFAERDTAISALAGRFVSHPWSVNFLLIVSPLVTWIWLGAMIIAFGGLIALWPVPAFARRRAMARAGATRRGSPAVAARETA
jgi:cytochrome c-type biogenesis protein CcmF